MSFCRLNSAQNTVIEIEETLPTYFDGIEGFDQLSVAEQIEHNWWPLLRVADTYDIDTQYLPDPVVEVGESSVTLHQVATDYTPGEIAQHLVDTRSSWLSALQQQRQLVVNSFSYEGQPTNLNETNLADLFRVRDWMSRQPEGIQVAWEFDLGRVVVYDLAGFTAFADACGAWEQAAFTNSGALTATINAATLPSQILAVDILSGWPVQS